MLVTITDNSVTPAAPLTMTVESFRVFPIMPDDTQQTQKSTISGNCLGVQLVLSFASLEEYLTFVDKARANNLA